MVHNNNNNNNAVIHTSVKYKSLYILISANYPVWSVLFHQSKGHVAPLDDAMANSVDLLDPHSLLVFNIMYIYVQIFFEWNVFTLWCCFTVLYIPRGDSILCGSLYSLLQDWGTKDRGCCSLYRLWSPLRQWEYDFGLYRLNSFNLIWYTATSASLRSFNILQVTLT